MRFTELRCQDPATRCYLGSPSLVRLPDGALVATHDYFGPGCPRNHEDEEHLTSVYRSEDGGHTWRNITHIANAYWSTLFIHRDALFLLGTSQQYGSIVIRRSDDGGFTWTHPRDEASGILFQGGPFRTTPNYHCAPVPVVEHHGRIYKAFEDFSPSTGNRRWWAPDFLATVISVPSDADLLRADSWTQSNRLRLEPKELPPAWLPMESPGWLEGNIVVAPDGTLRNLIRFHSNPHWDRAALMRVSPDGTELGLDPNNPFIDFPGGRSKFTIRRDRQTGLYYTLANGNADHDHPSNRSVLSLYESDDLIRWRHQRTLLADDQNHSTGEAARKTGFQYVDWQFDGDDLIALVRTAYGGAHNFHDSNRITFHRIERFRQR